MTTAQCDFREVMGNILETRQEARCIYVAGHGGSHYCPLDTFDHSDEIRLRVKQDALEALERRHGAIEAAARAVVGDWDRWADEPWNPDEPHWANFATAIDALRAAVEGTSNA